MKMSKHFPKGGLIAYTEDVVEFGVFRHSSNLEIGERRFGKPESCIVDSRRGVRLESYPLRRCGRGSKCIKLMLALYGNNVSGHKKVDDLERMRPGPDKRRRVQTSWIQATKRSTHCSRMRLRPCRAQGSSCVAFAINFSGRDRFGMYSRGGVEDRLKVQQSLWCLGCVVQD